MHTEEERRRKKCKHSPSQLCVAARDSLFSCSPSLITMVHMYKLSICYIIKRIAVVASTKKKIVLHLALLFFLLFMASINRFETKGKKIYKFMNAPEGERWMNTSKTNEKKEIFFNNLSKWLLLVMFAVPFNFSFGNK